MKKPGLKKSRPPGGGAAGRAYQFEIERDVDKKRSDSEQPKTTSKTPSSKTKREKKPGTKSD